MPQIKHSVFMRFKPTSSPQKIGEIFAALAGLRDLVPGVLDFSGGAHFGELGRNMGFTHGFVMTFADAASLAAYLPHPEHEQVKRLIFAELDSGPNNVMAFDWEHRPG